MNVFLNYFSKKRNINKIMLYFLGYTNVVSENI